jgi:hypothetical protein
MRERGATLMRQGALRSPALEFALEVTRVV